MITRKLRSAQGQSQREVVTVVVLGFILYYGYQMANVYGARILPPTQMVNKDFVCGDAVRSLRRRYNSGRVRVEACENPNRLVEWIRVNSASARFQSPDKAIEAENKRNSMMFGNGVFDVVDLS